MRTQVSLAVLCISLFAASVGAQDIWYVDDNGDSGNDCTSWEQACPELQSALNLAETGNQVWVAIGTYKPDYDIDTGKHTDDREASFQLINGVALYGGFAGTEETLEDRAGRRVVFDVEEVGRLEVIVAVRGSGVHAGKVYLDFYPRFRRFVCDLDRA